VQHADNAKLRSRQGQVLRHGIVISNAEGVEDFALEAAG
jgi:hypothetical protein